MVKYIMFAISVTLLTIGMTKTIEYFYTCIDHYAAYQERHIADLFEEAGL